MSKPLFGAKSDPRGNSSNLKVVPPKDLSLFTVIVTGSNAGIGLETARSFYQQGATVTLACRSQEKAEAAIIDLKSSTKLFTADDIELMHGSVEFQKLDLSKLSSARDFAEQWKADGGKKIDILVNNAGAIFLDTKVTEDGFEQSYQTNYLTPALLTLLLLPFIKLSPAGRIIQVSSYGAYNRTLDLKQLNGEKYQKKWTIFNKFSNSMDIYSNSKLYQVCFTRSLQEIISSSPDAASITVSAIHPGVVSSSIATADHYGFPKFVNSFLGYVFSLIGRTTTTGALTTLWASLSEEGGKNQGKFWADCAIADMPEGALDDELRSQFWTRTLKDCGMEDWKA